MSINAQPSGPESKLLNPAVTAALYGLLVVSAGLGLWVRRFPGAAPVLLERGAPWLFLVFALGFSSYRLSLVMARRYSPFKAFFQVVCAALFFMLLLPGFEVAPAEEPTLQELLRDSNPKVRAVAAELAGLKGEQGAELVRLLSDGDAVVRRKAHQALVRLNGGDDIGTETDADKWGARFK